MKLFFLFITLPLFVQNNLSAIENDISYDHVSVFEIKAKNEGFSLNSKTEISIKHLSKRSTDISYYFIPEPFYSSVYKLAAKLGEKRLGKSTFSFTYPKSKDVFLQDGKIHILNLPRKIKQGEQLFYSYRKSYSDLTFLPIIKIPNLDYLNSYKIIIKHPSDVKPEFSFFLPAGDVEYTIKPVGKKQTELIFSKIDKRRSLPYFPFNGMHAAVLVKLMRGQSLINSASPESFMEWYGKQISLTPSLALDSESALSAAIPIAENDLSKLRLIHDYVRENVRYIADTRAMGAFIPRQPDITLGRLYGDCKDKAYAISAIARNYDIKVNMALVSTEPDYSFKNDIHITQFNHVICQYNDGENDIFFDPTAKYCEFGNLPDGDIGTHAFILDPDGYRYAKITKPNNLPGIELIVDAEMDSLIRAKATITLRNDYLGDAVRALNELKKIDLENYLSNLITSHFYKISVDYFSLIEQRQDAIIFQATADLSKFLISSKTKTYIPRTPFTVFDNQILEREKDDYSIYLDNAFRAKFILNLKADGFSGKATDTQIGTTNLAGLNVSVTPEKDSFKITYDVNIENKIYHDKNKKLFIEFCKSYYTNKTNLIALERSSQ